MPRTCSVCRHAGREQIDKDLIAGRPLRSIAEHYGASATAVLRHKNQHLPRALMKARDVQEVAHGDALVDQMVTLNSRALTILKQAERAGNLEVALKAIAEVRRNHELIGKLLGDLGGAKVRTSAHVTVHQNRILAVRSAPRTEEELEAILLGGRPKVSALAERKRLAERRFALRQNGDDLDVEAPLTERKDY